MLRAMRNQCDGQCAEHASRITPADAEEKRTEEKTKNRSELPTKDILPLSIARDERTDPVMV